MATKTTTKKGGIKKALGIGAGIATLSAAAYYFLGPEGKAHQKKVKTWMTKAKKEMAGKLKEVKDVAEPIYERIVKEVKKK